MRNFTDLDRLISELEDDIYEQPPDAGHTGWAEEFIYKTLSLYNDYETVLDLGCGNGFCKSIFNDIGKIWTGVTIGADYDTCRENNLPVARMDFNFLKFADGEFDMLFSRHSLEHSFSPLYTLYHWRRIARKYLAVVLPNPKHFLWNGRNHYAVMTNSQFLWLAARAGWRAINKAYTNEEMRYVLVKAPPRKILMWESEEELQQTYGDEWRGV